MDAQKFGDVGSPDLQFERSGYAVKGFEALAVRVLGRAGAGR